MLLNYAHADDLCAARCSLHSQLRGLKLECNRVQLSPLPMRFKDVKPPCSSLLSNKKNRLDAGQDCCSSFNSRLYL